MARVYPADRRKASDSAAAARADAGNWAGASRRCGVFPGLHAARVPAPLRRRPVDPELLFVECGRCGAPVLWDPGRATRLLAQAGVDPLELDSSCLLMTDGCPFCRPAGQYTVQIYRVSNVKEGQLPPLVGHA